MPALPLLQESPVDLDLPEEQLEPACKAPGALGYGAKDDLIIIIIAIPIF